MEFAANNNKCSIIIPVYHGAKYILNLISQIEVCAQYASNVDFELILSNDAPNEPLADKMTSPHISIKVINTTQNRGIHGARVRGLQNSTGDYVLFLDQDDKIMPAYFFSQLKAIGSADAVICNALSGGQLKYNTDRPLYKAADRTCMINEGCMILSPGQVLMRRTAIPKVWVDNIMQHNGADDWLLWLCMHSARKQFVINQDVLFIREIHYHNASFDSLKMAESEREVVEIIESQALLYEEERKRLRELLSEIQEKRIRETEKFKKMFFIQNDWFLACCRGQTIAGYLRERQVKQVVIYGYGYLGKALYQNLKKSDIRIVYVIDKNADYLNASIPLHTLQDTLSPTDVVIVTLVSENREKITAQLREKLESKIYWLEDIVSELKEEYEKSSMRCKDAQNICYHSGL